MVLGCEHSEDSGELISDSEERRAGQREKAWLGGAPSKGPLHNGWLMSCVNLARPWRLAVW